jgi:hypothetical protein
VTGPAWTAPGDPTLVTVADPDGNEWVLVQRSRDG